MPLQPGARLGPYEILSLLGVGGMGEVYRARDTKLKRDVALKVLPDAFAQDAERMARFEREAQLLAALNHPNIAAIYGLEGSGGVRALVMELVEGPTLAERLRLVASDFSRTRSSPAEAGRHVQGESGLPVAEVLAIARQMADAFEAAHELGIVHRDLKPANVKVRPDGVVKVLDFGLTKALDPVAQGFSPALATNSPTLSMQPTQSGIILGTAAYMAPEQAKGKTVDKRADIWAFGVVLCEMLTGRQLYTGETVAETLARVIERTPDLSALPEATPKSIRDLLDRCLTKDPRSRLQAIGEARIVIERAIEHPGTETPAVSGGSTGPALRTVQPAGWRRTLPWTVAVGALAVAGALLVLWAPWRKAPAPAPLRLEATLGADASLVTDQGAAAELSPLLSQWQREQMKQLQSGGRDPQLEQFRWLLEELRVQLFAQELKTPVPVSVKRLAKIWQTMKR